jgi:hypothetical protein
MVVPTITHDVGGHAHRHGHNPHPDDVDGHPDSGDREPAHAYARDSRLAGEGESGRLHLPGPRGVGQAGRSRLARGRGMLAWTAVLFGVGGAGLVAWTGYIATSLPAHSVSTHYNVAWTGFDSLLAVLVLATAWLAYRRNPRVASASAATATLLLADAWFDITTATPGRPLLAAVLLAAFVELPAAALALQVHRKASARNRERNSS